MDIKGSLTRYILDNITEEIYKRGIQYASSGRVGQLKEMDNKLIASVAGSEIYRIEFNQGPKYIKAYCDCPDAESNDDYCKHIAAVAIVYDQSHGENLPSSEDINNLTIEVDRDFWKKIEEMFKNPLEADLKLLAVASDYSSWGVKPHAKISVHPTIKKIEKNLTTQGVIKGFGSISKIMAKSNFDHYFCAGEISAVFAETLDAVIFRLDYTQARIALKIFELCAVFYYEYLESIDGSDGIWQIPQARLPAIYKKLKEKGINEKELIKAGEHLNFLIDGWGDIFEDLGIN